ncbi:MAG: hypothetical protein AAF961_14545 [Planctomycetota bacterium]
MRYRLRTILIAIAGLCAAIWVLAPKPYSQRLRSALANSERIDVYVFCASTHEWAIARTLDATCDEEIDWLASCLTNDAQELDYEVASMGDVRLRMLRDDNELGVVTLIPTGHVRMVQGDWSGLSEPSNGSQSSVREWLQENGVESRF